MKPPFVATVRPVLGPPRVALPKGRIAQLVGGRVQVLGHDLRPQAAVTPDGVRALATLADGSLLVAGQRELHVLRPGQVRADVYPKVSIGAPLGWAWGDARARDRFWLMEETFLGENELPARAGEAVRPLGELAVPRAAVPLSGGRMAELGPGEIVLHGPSGRRPVALPDDVDLVHLVAGDGEGRGDLAWGADGEALWRLDLAGATAAVIARIELGGTVVSIDATEGRVAALVAAGEPPRWSVCVLDGGGRERWRFDPPFQPEAQDQGQLAVVLGRFDAVVAVGDETRLALWTLP